MQSDVPPSSIGSMAVMWALVLWVGALGIAIGVLLSASAIVRLPGLAFRRFAKGAGCAHPV